MPSSKSIDISQCCAGRVSFCKFAFICSIRSFVLIFSISTSCSSFSLLPTYALSMVRWSPMSSLIECITLHCASPALAMRLRRVTAAVLMASCSFKSKEDEDGVDYVGGEDAELDSGVVLFHSFCGRALAGSEHLRMKKHNIWTTSPYCPKEECTFLLQCFNHSHTH